MASSWISPPTRTELIEDLVSGVDRYNPSNVSILEDYLYHQIRSEEYDCLANLAILKLYQFNPELYNPDVIVNILLKALTASPLPDFNLCISLLDERPPNVNTDEPDPLPSLLPTLKGLHSLLYRCRFPAFWKAYRSEELENLRDNYTVEVVGFENAVREVAIRAVKAAFTQISTTRLGSYLDLTGADLEAYIRKLGWTIDPSSSVVNIPPNPDNQIEATVVQESINLPQLTKVISHAAKA
ncbi:putative component of the eukaryotic translation initiation factor 3 (eIF-3) complex, which is involved in protein synthesis of a specialized repertoire of mRNAs and, together with other initiation factors, stimulates binding of mRNA and methionyl-tRNAi to the 40S ribosome [Lyophyllum shimeji]|uniref:Eukaryotic translation initiation factor 3 subunit K n=1 Tax=Lyophyllum shimeji TaxID=47721 RepID=A0A9P3PHQ3_LYOSH|nr:putative component of the eukaryotic translation initiation factor 3 (eIF-3) complex, which is involved in protein synthesis of a specialized repertoire of mRNAs and, together with other initiation factors, stimulates binding of mRNA and methionyl-tRNAi to the 40S ribosome [Lyophyllum shimeji]